MCVLDGWAGEGMTGRQTWIHVQLERADGSLALTLGISERVCGLGGCSCCVGSSNLCTDHRCQDKHGSGCKQYRRQEDAMVVSEILYHRDLLSRREDASPLSLASSEGRALDTALLKDSSDFYCFKREHVVET